MVLRLMVKEKNASVVGALKKNCIFAPLFNKVFRGGENETASRLSVAPLRKIQCKFYQKSNDKT